MQKQCDFSSAEGKQPNWCTNNRTAASLGGFRSAEPPHVWMERASHGKEQAAWKDVGSCGLQKESPFPSMGFSAWFLPLCLQKPSQLELCIASKGSETSTCQEIYPSASSEESLHSLNPHLCFPCGKVRSQPQLMLGMSQSYHTWEGVINHPSSSTSPCFSFWPCVLCLDVHVPHQDSPCATFSTSFSISSTLRAAIPGGSLSPVLFRSS